MKNKQLMSSESVEWFTPPDIIKLVNEVFGDIDLDPCSPPTPSIPAKKYYTMRENGLLHEWHGRIFMNPPYGRGIDKWVDKVMDEYEAGNVKEAILLLPARTETRWFRRLTDFKWCAVNKRIKFGGKDGSNSATFPSAIFYLGWQPKKFSKVFSKIGIIWVKEEL